MAGTTHYRYTFMNPIFELWKIEIIDTTYAGTDFADVYPDSSGYELNWQGASGGEFQAIIPSTFTAYLERDTSTMQLISDIVSNAEGTFIV